MFSPRLQMMILSYSLFLLTEGCVKNEVQDQRQADASPAGRLETDGLGDLDAIGNPFGDSPLNPANIESAEEPEESESLSEVLPQCGVDDLSDRQAQIFSTSMNFNYIREINSGVASAFVELTSYLQLDGTLDETTLDVAIEVGELQATSELGEVIDLSSVQARANEISEKFIGPVTNYTTPNNSNFDDQWDGILCTINEADSLLNLRQGYRTEVSFYPSFAPNISPIADPIRYEREIGDHRVFTNIEATVTATDNPILEVGKVYRGSILVEKVTPYRQTPYGVIQGDRAYRLTANFEDPEITIALGIHLWTEYYIDHKQRAFSAIIANVGDRDLMYFIGEYTGETDGSSPTPAASYNANIGELLNNNCTGCHNSASPDRVDLSSYAGASANASLANQRIQAGTMPPGAPLSAADKALFQNWIDTNTPENQ